MPLVGGSVAGMFRDAALGNPDGVALWSGAERMSYRDLDAAVDRLSQALLDRGVAHGDRVAILSENSVRYVTVILACARIGAIATCLNWRQTAADIAYCLSLTSPRMVFFSAGFAHLLAEPMRAGITAVDMGAGYQAMLADSRPLAHPVPVESEDGLLILFTSGTTGRPKAPVISHRAVIMRGLLMRADWGIRRDDGFIAWSPLSHMAAADPTLATLMQGGTVSILPGFDPAGIAEALTRHPVGWMILMPGMIERMAEELERRNQPLQRVAAAGCMANLVPADQIARISRLLDAPFLNSFGSTETGIAPASGNWIAPGTWPASLAKLQTSACEIRLSDEAGRAVPAGGTGELWLRSPALFSGYWADPQANEAAFADGWYHMGDDFHRDAEGLLHFADRSKYLIKSGGENIYPAEIELVLRNLDGISDAVVVRRADPTWGEVPVAFVVPAADATPTVAEIRAELAARLARFKLPKAIYLIAEHEIERNATGKIRRNLLEQRAQTGAMPEERG